MRIIGGNFKGKKILLPLDKNTRPLRDLVKESIFNLILHSNKLNLRDYSSVLDLFSGSGSSGPRVIILRVGGFFSRVTRLILRSNLFKSFKFKIHPQ